MAAPEAERMTSPMACSQVETGKRFLVTIEGRDLADTKVLHEFASNMDFGKLTALQPKSGS